MARPSTKEEHIETYLVNRVKALGGFSLKTDTVSGRRFLDRTCFLPGGRVVVVELKRPSGGVLAKHQAENIRRLQALGHEVYRCNTKEQVDQCLDMVEQQSSCKQN